MLPAGVCTVAAAGRTGMAIGSGAEMPPVTETSSGGGCWPGAGVAGVGGAGVGAGGCGACARPGVAASSAIRVKRMGRIILTVIASYS